MDVHGYSLSWASYTYAYCILTLLCGDGLAALYYNDMRGQPELQQAMDNAPLPPPRNLLPFSSEDDQDVPFLLTEKTSALLSEALHMLQKIKGTRERRWFEAFVHRLGSLATPLEENKSVETANEVQIEIRKHKKEPEKDVSNFFKQINSQHFADFTNADFVHGRKHSILENDDGVELEKEGAAANEESELPNGTASLSRLQVMHGIISKEHEPIKYLLPAEPTMSDEMERQLRAGKIVVLSHSLVRTNFKSKHSNKKE